MSIPHVWIPFSISLCRYSGGALSPFSLSLSPNPSLKRCLNNWINQFHPVVIARHTFPSRSAATAKPRAPQRRRYNSRQCVDSCGWLVGPTVSLWSYDERNGWTLFSNHTKRTTIITLSQQFSTLLDYNIKSGDVPTGAILRAMGRCWLFMAKKSRCPFAKSNMINIKTIVGFRQSHRACNVY